MKQSMQVLTSSETNEWYTPPYIIEMVREVLGKIDLDPASNWLPQTWIQAKEYFWAPVHDGLKHIWKGKVFCNPPYGKTGTVSNQEIWAAWMRSCYELGDLQAGVLLTKTVPGYNWWDELFNHLWPGPCCITRNRIEFLSQVTLERIYHTENKIAPDRARRGKSKAASTFWYCGPDEQKFREVFSKIGRVIPRGDLYDRT